jgi:hypothetical protein
MKQPRVTNHWSPESSILSINRPHDQSLSYDAVEHGAMVGDEAASDLFTRRHALWRGPDAIYGVTFHHDDAEAVIGSIALYLIHNPERAALQRRGTGLIGCLMVAVTDQVPPTSMPIV